MFAIAFDLVVADTIKFHPSRNATTAYNDIRNLLGQHGFTWRQGSLYTTDDDDMARLFAAIMALKSLPWFPLSVRDIRAFRVEQWSDFTAIIKGPTG
jgi:virulence-associated protein VapD